MRIGPLISATSVGTAIVLFAIGSGAQTRVPLGTSDEISSVRITPERAISTVWIAARMRAAQPLSLPAIELDAARATLESRHTNSSPLRSTKPGPPPESVHGSGNARSYPLAPAGKLFFKVPEDSVGRSCSAQFIDRNVILTAAHCVMQSDPPYAWFSDFGFASQYERGASKHVYHTSCVANNTGWAKQGETQAHYDFAMLRTTEPSDVWFGVQFNWAGLHDEATMIGYPRGALGGQIIQVETGTVTVKNDQAEMRHELKIDLHGASGGAWIANFSSSPKDGANRVISISTRDVAVHGKPIGLSIGPYFNDAVRRLLNYVRNGCKHSDSE